MNFYKLFRRVTLLLWLAILHVLVLATVAEKQQGTEAVHAAIYGATWFTVLWGAAAGASLGWLLFSRVFRRKAVFLLHGAFAVILAGALTTHFTAERGTVHLRIGESVGQYVSEQGAVRPLGWSLQLDDFNIVYYEGTSSPVDYRARVRVIDAAGQVLKGGEVAMNRVFTCEGWRIYQSGYDSDGRGCVFLLAHDPWGIGLTYAGYLLLLAAIGWLALRKVLRGRGLCGRMARTVAVAVGVAVLSSSCQSVPEAAAAPKVLPREVAARFGDLAVSYNGRVCPMQTLARDFCLKLSGKPSYRGYSAEQVFTGFLFFYSDWRKQPLLKVGGGAARMLAVEERYAAWSDFRAVGGDYKLSEVLAEIRQNPGRSGARSVVAADEKFNLIASLYAGKLLKIYPFRSADESGRVDWYAQGDRLPDGMGDEEWFFVRKSWDYIFELVVNRDYAKLAETLDKLRKYQRRQAGVEMPTATHFGVEKWHNRWLRLNGALGLAFVSLVWSGLSFFALFGGRFRRFAKHTVGVPAMALWLFLTAMLAVRAYIGGHVPLSNGAETMLFMAWCASGFAVAAFRRYRAALPFGLVISLLTIAVAGMGEANPPVTPLVPVLASPLLSLHVATIMIAYSLLALMMCNGVAACVLAWRQPDDTRRIRNMYRVSRGVLYPAVFLLTIGIFLGAVWANVSWGRYWGWDPKEVWALITMLVYAAALHTETLPRFRRPMFFHGFTVVAFLSVLITYFGVNYLLGGLHGYAG